MLKTISADAYRKLFDNTDEFAVVDTREISQFYAAHLLAASNLPLSRLEIDAPHHIPQRDTLVVLCDWGTAVGASTVLQGLGYTNIAALEGGLAGWHLAGGRLFPGWNAIGKAFGSYIYKTRPTPTISADELAEAMTQDRPPLVPDTRTPHEHSEYCIPGAVSCPNGETLYRALGTITDPDRLVVMHCAGHTRGIMGAQVLIDAGLPNKIVSLNLGTLEWALDGRELESGSSRAMPVPADPAPARQAAARLIKQHGLSVVETSQIEQWERSTDQRTLFVIDVRTAEEFESGTWPGARHIAGGQMLQGADRYLVTRNARRVLLDTDGVRAATTASWLKQMGYGDVHICTAHREELSDIPQSNPGVVTDDRALETLKVDVDAGRCTIVDIRGGVPFRRSHVSGSWFLTRVNLTTDVAQLPPTPKLGLVTDDRPFAEMMATELQSLGYEVTRHGDDLARWQTAGFALSSGTENIASEPHDAVYDLEELEVHLRDSHDYILWRESLYYIVGGDPAAPYMNLSASS